MSLINFTLAQLDTSSAKYRQGYRPDILRASVPDGDGKYKIDHSTLKEIQAKWSPQITGAGDAFALIAQPAAKLIDKVAGTDLANCLPCKQRRERWNKAIPFKS